MTPAAHEREDVLLRRYRRDRNDVAARDEIVRRHLALARRLARRYGYAAGSRDDLEQVAALGLMKALDRYDPDRGVPFRAFAAPTIVGELRRYFRDATWTMRPSRTVQELAVRVENARSRLTAELGREVTVHELAAFLGCRREEVLEAAAAWNERRPLSLETGPTVDGGPFVESIGDVDQAFDSVDAALTLRPALAALSARDRMIVMLRFEAGLTQSAIATRVGLSQMHVSRILRRSIERLRAAVEATPPAAEDVAA